MINPAPDSLLARHAKKNSRKSVFIPGWTEERWECSRTEAADTGNFVAVTRRVTSSFGCWLRPMTKTPLPCALCSKTALSLLSPQVSTEPWRRTAYGCGDPNDIHRSF